MKLSTIIIAKNEEKMLPECLKSLKWVSKNNGEVLLIDTGSTDQTIKIAKKFGARVVSYKSGKTFSDWRNKGAREAKGEWILYIDADERVTKELREEIDSRLRGNDGIGGDDEEVPTAYAIPRINIVLGQKLKHGGFYPDYQKRLFKKDKFEKWTGDLHEEPLYSGELGQLDNPMIHDKHETLSEMVEKTNKWSNIEGKLMFEAGHPEMNILRFLTAMFREFWYRMISKRAFLDGKVGIIFAIYQVFSRFVSYAKLWELQIKNESSNT